MEGKRVLLTGASSGIGRALAKAMASKGAAVAVSARRGELLEELAGEVESDGGRRPVVLVSDLAVRGNAADLATRATRELGEIDVLVNNAGVSVHGLQWALGDRDEAREAFETDFWSPLALIQALAPRMRRRGSGAIVNVTSLIQVSPFPVLGHTCAAKAALANATETLRLELDGSGVQVVEAILGPVDTPGSAETRLLRGGKQWLDGTGLKSCEDTASAILSAIERGRDRLVYPSKLKPVYALPALGRRYARRFTKYVDADDTTIRRGGSLGDDENRARRADWEARQDGNGSAPVESTATRD